MSSMVLARQLIGKKVFLKNHRKPVSTVVDVIYNNIISRAVCLVVDKCSKWKEVRVVPMHAISDVKTKSVIVSDMEYVFNPENYSHNVAKVLGSSTATFNNLSRAA